MYVDWKVTGKQQAEGKRVKTSVATWATIIQEAHSQGQNSLDNLYIPSLTICFFVHDDSSPLLGQQFVTGSSFCCVAETL